MKTKCESGIALITVLLILVLMGALLQGFILSVNSDQQLISTDRKHNQAFYGALAGLEQMTADLGNLFLTNFRPTTAQITALAANPPAVAHISFILPGGGDGYQITPESEEIRNIPTGPYEGMVGLVRPYTMTVTARAFDSGEVQLQRRLQTVAIPVFQFGFFSESDLSYFSGTDFDFGGRVHTNGNLFLSGSWTSTLTMKDRVTAVGEVIRRWLPNGYYMSSGGGHNPTIRIVTSPGAFRNLADNEGSVVGNASSAKNEPTWTNVSIGSYNGNIRNGRTGATKMNLPLVSAGAAPIDIIRRPPPNEHVDNLNVFDQRFFKMASLRILLSDTAADITSLPTVTPTAPVNLSDANITVDGTTYALAASARKTSGSPKDTDYLTPSGSNLIGGFLKIDMQDAEGNWTDVTGEILKLGINGSDLTPTPRCAGKASVADAIIRVQRFKDSPASSCSALTAKEFWPNVLYDAREGLFRESSSPPSEPLLGGVFHYMELDIRNLCRWLRGEIGSSGASAINETGYVVYFSDRRSNRNASGNETGEYGFEDVVNGPVSSGLPNGALNQGEDLNSNGILDTYGATRQLSGQTFVEPFISATPATAVAPLIARKNRAIFFRRALKLTNGETISLKSDSDGNPFGLTVVAENPIYIQGNYNADATRFYSNYDGAHVATSVIGDAVTLLSNNWNDRNSFNGPHQSSNREAATTYYRTAVISGKNMSFNNPTGTFYDFGTDGGAHNFMRLLEDWGGQTLFYKGSVVSLYYSRQGVGTFKYGNNNVYYPPTRGLSFDVEFLTFKLLPPRTPMFRDVNITGFTRNIMPKE